MVKSSASKQSKQSQMSILMIALGTAVVVLLATLIAVLLQPPKVVSNFDQCKAAGGSVMESYPERCLINGTTFTNTVQTVKSDDYIGLTEKAALAKAKQSNTPARVVERDGKSLAITMDFAAGRHNLFVKDGKVYKVDIEGDTTSN